MGKVHSTLSEIEEERKKTGRARPRDHSNASIRGRRGSEWDSRQQLFQYHRGGGRERGQE